MKFILGLVKCIEFLLLLVIIDLNLQNGPVCHLLSILDLTSHYNNDGLWLGLILVVLICCHLLNGLSLDESQGLVGKV